MDDRAGVTRSVIAPAQPSAGSGVTVTLPEAVYMELVAVTFRLVTSAVVATRTPVVSVLDGSSVALAAVAAGYGATANTTADYSFVAGVAEWDQSNNANASGGLGPFPIDAGDSLAITVGAIDAGDQISRVRVIVLQRNVRDDD